jgi:hypothetical protein
MTGERAMSLKSIEKFDEHISTHQRIVMKNKQTKNTNFKEYGK